MYRGVSLPKPVPALRHRYLKPRPFSRFPGFGNPDVGQGKNFSCKVETIPSFTPETPGKNPFLVLGRHTCTIITEGNNKPVRLLPGR